jgi:hypothetical protein
MIVDISYNVCFSKNTMSFVPRDVTCPNIHFIILENIFLITSLFFLYQITIF